MSAIHIALRLVSCIDRLTEGSKPGELHRPAKNKWSGEPTEPTTVDTKTGKPTLDRRNGYLQLQPVLVPYRCKPLTSTSEPERTGVLESGHSKSRGTHTDRRL